MGILSGLGRMVVKPKPKPKSPRPVSPATPGRGDGWMRTEWEANRQLGASIPKRGLTGKGGDPYNMTGSKLSPSKPKNLRKK